MLGWDFYNPPPRPIDDPLTTKTTVGNTQLNYLYDIYNIDNYYKIYSDNNKIDFNLFKSDYLTLKKIIEDYVFPDTDVDKIYSVVNLINDINYKNFIDKKISSYKQIAVEQRTRYGNISAEITTVIQKCAYYSYITLLYNNRYDTTKIRQLITPYQKSDASTGFIVVQINPVLDYGISSTQLSSIYNYANLLLNKLYGQAEVEYNDSISQLSILLKELYKNIANLIICYRELSNISGYLSDIYYKSLDIYNNFYKINISDIKLDDNFVYLYDNGQINYEYTVNEYNNILNEYKSITDTIINVDNTVKQTLQEYKNIDKEYLNSLSELNDNLLKVFNENIKIFVVNANKTYEGIVYFYYTYNKYLNTLYTDYKNAIMPEYQNRLKKITCHLYNLNNTLSENLNKQKEIINKIIEDIQTKIKTIKYYSEMQQQITNTPASEPVLAIEPSIPASEAVSVVEPSTPAPEPVPFVEPSTPAPEPVPVVKPSTPSTVKTSWLPIAVAIGILVL